MLPQLDLLRQASFRGSFRNTTLLLALAAAQESASCRLFSYISFQQGGLRESSFLARSDGGLDYCSTEGVLSQVAL